MLEYQTNESFELVPAMTCPMYGESLVLKETFMKGNVEMLSLSCLRLPHDMSVWI